LGKIWPVYQSNSAQRQIATILWAHEGAFSAAAQTQPPRGGIIPPFVPVVEKVAPSVVTVLRIKLCRGRLRRFLTIFCSDSKCEPTAAVGWTSKSNKTVTIFSCHFARKSQKAFDYFHICLNGERAKRETST
jgi:hypothetical protein